MSRIELIEWLMCVLLFLRMYPHALFLIYYTNAINFFFSPGNQSMLTFGFPNPTSDEKMIGFLSLARESTALIGVTGDKIHRCLDVKPRQSSILG